MASPAGAAGTRRGLALAATLVVAAPLVRTGMWIVTPARRIEIGEAFSTIGDALATGCLLAGLQDWLAPSRPICAFCVRVGLPLSRCWALPPTPARVTRSSTAWWTDRAEPGDRAVYRSLPRLPDDRVGRLLETRPLAGLGVLSYSLYLWQEPFLNRLPARRSPRSR